MTNFRKACVGAAAVLMALAWSATGWGAMSSANYSIPNDVIGGGGNTMSSANYTLSSTLGQPSPLGDAASAGYANHPGFWQADEAIYDADGDGLTNAQEAGFGTDPYKADTDGDGLSDYVEAITNPCLDPLNDDTDGDGLKDGQEDANHNGVLNPGETNPCNPDSDHDGLSDGQEVLTYLTNPLDWDSDHDFIPDKFEADHIGDPGGSFDPLNPADALLDYDGDGNNNLNDYWNRDGHVYIIDPVPGKFDNPACFYWSDNDGDGIPSPIDVAKLRQEIAGIPQDYSHIIPPTIDTTDLDRDGISSPLDNAAMLGIVSGSDRPAGYTGAPDHFEIESSPSAPVMTGDTTHISLSVRNLAGLVPYSSGFGTVFWVQSGAATLIGGEGSQDGGPAGNRYDMSMDSAGHALCTIVVRVDGAGPIEINARIPVCGAPTVGRWANGINLSAPITITGQ